MTDIRGFVNLLLMVGVCGLTACSHATVATLKEANPERDAYFAAFASLQQCVQAVGFPAPDAVWNPVTGTSLLFGIDMGAAPDGTAAEEANVCLEAWWAVSNDYERSQPVEMDSRVRQRAVDCIRSSGASIDAAAATPLEMIESIESENPTAAPDRTVASCISDAVYEVFPDLQGLIVPLDR